jgi:hypothetical protein
MVNPSKIEKKLPSLLMDSSAQRVDNDYMRNRSKISQLKRKQPSIYNRLLEGIVIAIDNLDKAAEQDGFSHIGLDEKGNIITYRKKR